MCPTPSPANWPTWVCPKDLGASNPVPPTGQLGCVQNRRNVPKNVAGAARPLAGPRPVCSTKQHLTPKAHLANWRAPWAARTHLSRAGAQVPRADWRVTQTARRGPRTARPSTAPLQAPGAAGALDGEVLTNKSSQGRADAQRLVATRLLDRVHDPLGHFSRLQRIYPRAW